MTQIISANATQKSGDFLAKFLRVGWKICGAVWRKLRSISGWVLIVLPIHF
jgi:hypothetical protein